MRRSRGFTLIELLIVVAIIAILAAIALPNLLQAQMRARVARAISDQRVIATAIESYNVDYARLPMRSALNRPIDRMPAGLRVLTTPIAYAGTSFDIFVDPFGRWNFSSNALDDVFYDTIYASIRGRNSRTIPNDGYAIESVGPDHVDSIHSGAWGSASLSRYFFKIYDPTNGMISTGDIYRVGGRLPVWFVEGGYPMVAPSG